MEGERMFIPCPFKYSQVWLINGTSYSLLNLPIRYRFIYLGLETVADREINGTEFQCLMSQDKDDSFGFNESLPVTVHVKAKQSGEGQSQYRY